MSRAIIDQLKLPQDPIFVVGYPRSGTTLVQALLATQRNIYSLPETHFFNVINRKTVKTDDRGFVDAACLDQVFARIYEKIDLRFSRSEQKYIIKLAKKKKLLPKMLFEFIVYHYICEDIKDKDAESFRWVEKTPNHAYFLESIFSVYPRALFINIIRHPVPAIYSRKVNFPFNKDKPLDWLAKLWRRSVEETEKFNRVHPGKLFSLKYEDLTADLETGLTKMCDFVKVDLDLELINNHSAAAGRVTLESEVWKKKDEYRKISNTNDKYRQVVPPEDAALIENLLADKMEQYGYVSFFTNFPPSVDPAGGQTFEKV